MGLRLSLERSLVHVHLISLTVKSNERQNAEACKGFATSLVGAMSAPGSHKRSEAAIGSLPPSDAQVPTRLPPTVTIIRRKESV